MGKYASTLINQAKTWIGCKESDGSHRKIIDVYNAHKPLARGYSVKYTDAWCATFVSACAIATGMEDIIPLECSCNCMIQGFKNKGVWIEDESVTPKPGYIILYDWDDNGVGDNKGSADHVGIIEKVSGGKITIIEGNYSNSVKRRTLNVNARYIRGYGAPKYDAEPSGSTTPVTGSKSIEEIAKEVIDGKWGKGSDRKTALTNAGYDYSKVQDKVNALLGGSDKTETAKADPKPTTVKIEYAQSKESGIDKGKTLTTIANLNFRTGAGTNKSIIKVLSKGATLTWYGYYTLLDNVKWYLVTDSTGQNGFVSSQFLK